MISLACPNPTIWWNNALQNRRPPRTFLGKSTRPLGYLLPSQSSSSLSQHRGNHHPFGVQADHGPGSMTAVPQIGTPGTRSGSSTQMPPRCRKGQVFQNLLTWLVHTAKWSCHQMDKQMAKGQSRIYATGAGFDQVLFKHLDRSQNMITWLARLHFHSSKCSSI